MADYFIDGIDFDMEENGRVSTTIHVKHVSGKRRVGPLETSLTRHEVMKLKTLFIRQEPVFLEQVKKKGVTYFKHTKSDIKFRVRRTP